MTADTSYDIRDIRQVLPKEKEKFTSFEEFINEILHLVSIDIDSISKDLVELFRVIYFELTEEEYKSVRNKRRTVCSTIKENAAFLTKVLSESQDKIKDINIALDMIAIKESTINKIISKKFFGCTTLFEITKRAEEITITEEDVVEFITEYRKRTRGNRTNPLFITYTRLYEQKEVIFNEMLKNIEKRIKGRKLVDESRPRVPNHHVLVNREINREYQRIKDR